MRHELQAVDKNTDANSVYHFMVTCTCGFQARGRTEDEVKLLLEQHQLRWRGMTPMYVPQGH